jgi:DNA repair photolyase
VRRTPEPGMVTYKRIRVKTALSKSGLYDLDYAYNPYVGCFHGCVYCYARAYVRDEEVSRNWGTVVYIKENILEVLREEVKKKPRGVVGVSTLTDPYQPIEAGEGLTRRGIQVLLQGNFKVSIQTKSPLVTRDIDILKSYVSHVDVGFTITILDPDVSRLIEPNAPPPAERIKALREVSRAGIPTWIFIGPIIRDLNDSRENLEEIITLAVETGSKVYYDYLHTKPGIRDSMRHLVEKNPNMLAISPRWINTVESRIQDLCRKYLVDCKAAFPREEKTCQSKLTQYLERGAK